MDVSNCLSDMPDYLSSSLMNHCLPTMPSLVCQRNASLLNKSCKEKIILYVFACFNLLLSVFLLYISPFCKTLCKLLLMHGVATFVFKTNLLPL